jgi:rod shape-determining protein MreD
MRLTTGSSVRIVALVVLTVFVQFSLVSQLTVGGASAELEPLVVIALALLLGPEIGAIVGFSMGLFADLVLLQTLGISSLVYLALGYWAGRFKELRIRDNDWPRLLPMAAAGVGTFLATAGYAFILYLLGDATLASAVVMREVFLTTR